GHLDHVLVDDLRDGLGLEREPLAIASFAGEAWREHLEREAFADRRVLRQEHGPHAARAEHLEQAIAARDDVARVQGGILERRRGGGGRGGFVLGLRLVARRGCGGGWCVARGRRNRVVFGRRGGCRRSVARRLGCVT